MIDVVLEFDMDARMLIMNGYVSIRHGQDKTPSMIVFSSYYVHRQWEYDYQLSYRMKEDDDDYEWHEEPRKFKTVEESVAHFMREHWPEARASYFMYKKARINKWIKQDHEEHQPK